MHFPDFLFELVLTIEYMLFDCENLRTLFAWRTFDRAFPTGDDALRLLRCFVSPKRGSRQQEFHTTAITDPSLGHTVARHADAGATVPIRVQYRVNSAKGQAKAPAHKLWHNSHKHACDSKSNAAARLRRAHMARKRKITARHALAISRETCPRLTLDAQK